MLHAGPHRMGVIVTTSFIVASAFASSDAPYRSAGLVPVGSDPVDVRLADVDGDGVSDLLVANDGSTELSLHRGVTAQSFADPVTIEIGAVPGRIQSGDFDGDGHVDLAVLCGAVNGVRILIGHGDGTFAAPVAHAVGTDPRDLELVDVDGDGAIDLVTADFGADTVTILSGAGDGTFAAQPAVSIGVMPICVAVADLGGDGVNDLIVGVNGGGELRRRDGLGGGAYAPELSIPTFSGQRDDLHAGDFNGDGRTDLVGRWVGYDGATILLQQPDGSFDEDGAGSAAYDPVALDVVDLDLDGTLDLVMSREDSRALDVAFGDGAGNFTQPRSWPMFADVGRFAIGPADRDGVRVLALVRPDDDACAIVVFDPADPLRTPSAIPGGDYGLQVIDIDLDGIPDLGWTRGNSFLMRRGLGDGTFGERTVIGAGTNARAFGVADFNGDGHLDVVVCNHLSENVSVSLSNGDGTFQSDETFTTLDDPIAVVTADVDQDGDQDIVVGTNVNLNTIWVLTNDGAADFERTWSAHAGFGVREMRSGDLNGDGVTDLVVTSMNSDEVRIFFGLGDGTFTQPVIRTFPDREGLRLGVGDFDADGDLDLVVSASVPGEIIVLRNSGIGAFAEAGVYATALFVGAPAVGDVDGDGVLDLIAVSLGNVSLFRGLGGAQFAAAELIIEGDDFDAPLLADIDLDGQLELVHGVIGSHYELITMYDNLCALPCAGDVTNDGAVDFDDLLAVLAAWGTCPSPPCAEDVDGDGVIGFGGVLDVLAAWGSCP